jgi:hypothetical protein
MAATHAAVMGAEHMYQQQALTAADQPHISTVDGSTLRWRGYCFEQGCGTCICTAAGCCVLVLRGWYLGLARPIIMLVCCCVVLPVAVQVVWVFRVQDTPGYGDDQDISRHIGMIIQHINTQNTKWLDMESARDRCARDVLIRCNNRRSWLGAQPGVRAHSSMQQLSLDVAWLAETMMHAAGA